MPVGTFGEITFQPVDSGAVRARAYYRDWDGARRLVEAVGPTQARAERALKVKLPNAHTSTRLTRP